MKTKKDIERIDNICMELQIRTYEHGDNWENYWSYLNGWRDCLSWLQQPDTSEEEIRKMKELDIKLNKSGHEQKKLI